MAASLPIPKTIYLGTFVHCASLTELDICETGAIGVDEQGVIAFIERDIQGFSTFLETHSEWESAKVVEIPKEKNGFFFPGFIDTHTHAPQHPNTGLFGKTTLLSWLQTYTFPRESSLSSLPLARKVYSNFISRTLSHGTTTAAYYATIHVPATNLLADLCLARGQRALVGRVCMNSDLSPEYYRDASVATAISYTQACIAHIRGIDPDGAIVRPIVTPRFAPSCTAPCLAALGKLAAEENAHIQTHISENTSEIALVAELFPDAESYTHVYDSAALLTPRTILAHAIHLSSTERDLIAQRGAKISHCPASNTAITSGCCPVRELLELGLDVGLGSDVSGGFSPSILENVRQAVWVSRHIAMGKEGQEGGEKAKLATEEALWLGTRGGAKVVGLEGRVGGFEVGMEWDAQRIELGAEVEGEEGDSVQGFGGPVDVFGWESAAERVEKWVYSGDDRNVKGVWVRGRLVHGTGE